jgi:hypothetical protein
LNLLRMVYSLYSLLRTCVLVLSFYVAKKGERSKKTLLNDV